MEKNNPDSVLISTVGVTISKITLYICATVAVGMLISTCKMDEKIVIQCEESCGERGIKEVNSTSCECNEPSKTSSNPFMRP